jgi:hypothetical protein
VALSVSTFTRLFRGAGNRGRCRRGGETVDRTSCLAAAQCEQRRRASCGCVGRLGGDRGARTAGAHGIILQWPEHNFGLACLLRRGSRHSVADRLPYLVAFGSQGQGIVLSHV